MKAKGYNTWFNLSRDYVMYNVNGYLARFLAKLNSYDYSYNGTRFQYPGTLTRVSIGLRGISCGFYGGGAGEGVHVVANSIEAFSFKGTVNTSNVDLAVLAKIGIGITSPSALLHLAAGTTTVAPVKFTSGTNLTTPQAGTIEYDGCRFSLTNVATQRAIDRTGDVALASVTVSNTTTETTLWTAIMPANSLCIGNILKFQANGVVSK